MVTSPSTLITDIPLMGRLGGGNGGENAGTSNSAESRIPGFLDRMLDIVESSILKQPHFTTKELETTLKKALNEAFGSGGVPVRVLKFDTEKILLKLSFGGGYGWTSDQFGNQELPVSEELDTDAGLPDVLTIQGQFGVGFRAGLDLVVGVKFRSYEPELDHDGEPIEGERKYTPSIFVVVDKTALNNLMGTPDSKAKGTELYSIQTEKGAVLPDGVEFVGLQNGKNPPQGHVNAELPEDTQFRWDWGEKKVDLKHERLAKGKIIGYYDDLEKDKSVKALEISLEQPQAIEANAHTSLQITAIPDPDHLLESTRAHVKGKRTLVKKALNLLEQGVEFKDVEIQVKDIYKNTSQPLKATFTAKVKQKADSTVGSVSPQRYEASLSVDSTIPIPEIPQDGDFVVVSETSADQISTFEADQVTLSGDELNKTEKVYARESPWEFETKNGKIKLTAKLNRQNYQWKWAVNYIAAGRDSIDWGRDEQGYPKFFKDVSFTIKPVDGVGSQDFKYTILGLSGPKFTKIPSKKDETKLDPVTKISVELGANLDIGTSLQFLFIAASLDQAVLQPANPAEGKEIPKVFKELVGKSSDRDKIVQLPATTERSINCGVSILAEDQVLCDHILDLENWEDPADGTKGIAKYEDNVISCLGSYEQVKNGEIDCAIDPSPTTEIQGRYGTLLVNPNGRFSYRLAKALTINDSYVLNCAEDDVEDDPLSSEDQALCTHILATTIDANGNTVPANWNDPEDGTDGILPFMGREASCPGTFDDVVTGETDCTISSAKIIISGKKKDDLKLFGVPSLESAAAVDGKEWGDNAPNENTGWTVITDLDNSMTLHQLYEYVKSGDASSTYGVQALSNEFSIKTNQDYGSNLKQLVLTINPQNVLEFEFDGEKYPDYECRDR